MYSSIMKTNPRPGDWLAILGAGGGLGHMYYSSFFNSSFSFLTNNFMTRGVQIAVKKGLKVLAIDKYVSL